jgi:hypothetical protein
MDHVHVHLMVDFHKKLFDNHYMIVDLHQMNVYLDIENELLDHLYM